MARHRHRWVRSRKWAIGRVKAWECDTCGDIRDHDDLSVLADAFEQKFGKRMPLSVLRATSAIELAALATAVAAA